MTLERTPLHALYEAHAEGSFSQSPHPSLAPWLGTLRTPPRGHLEAQRHQAMERFMPVRGRSVLDIGAGTGYFSLAAWAHGARRVVAREPNPAAAGFLSAAVGLLGAGDRLEVQPWAHDFTQEPDAFFDITLCLNVLQHAAPPDGSAAPTPQALREHILTSLNRLAPRTHTLFLQIGPHWRDQPGTPWLAGGRAEWVDFLRQGTAGRWRLDDVVVASGLGHSFEPLCGRHAGPAPGTDEFHARPLFHLTSLAL